MTQKEKNIQSYLKAKKEFIEFDKKHGRSQLVDGFAIEYCNTEKVPEELINRCPKCKHLFTIDQRKENSEQFISCPCGDTYADITENYIRLFIEISNLM